MERNTRSSLADAVELAAILPWQLGGALALLAYWILRELSAPLPTGNGDGITPGGFLQYGIPGLLLMLALLSFYRTLQADGSSMAGASSTTPEPLERITTQGIETLVAEAFRRGLAQALVDGHQPAVGAHHGDDLAIEAALIGGPA